MTGSVVALAEAAVRELNDRAGVSGPVRSPKRDGCPNACRGVLVVPHTWHQLGDVSYRGWYQCPKCSREWFTSWRLA